MASLFAAWRNWRERGDVLRDVRAQNVALREWDDCRVQDNLADALTALERNDHRHAAEIWTKALDRSPREARASPLALDVLIGLGRFDEAETIMKEGRTRYPTEIRFAAGLAEISRAKGDHEAACGHWAAVHRQFPNAMVGYASGVDALRNLNRLPEAEALAEQTIRRFPHEVLGYMEYARIAGLRRDWGQTLQRWDLVRTQFNHPSGYAGAGHAMIELGRYDEAEAMLRDARIRAPTDVAPFIELALCAQARGDTAVAIERWLRLADVFPLHLVSCLTAAGGLQGLGATEDAEHVLRDAIDHFPAEPGPIEHLGLLLLNRGDFAAAVVAFIKMRDTFPNNRASYIRLSDSLNQAGRFDEAEAVRVEQRQRFQ